MLRQGTLFVFLALAAGARIRDAVVSGDDENYTKVKTNLCNQWLVIEYDDGLETNTSVRSFRYLDGKWGNVPILSKKTADGCVKIYTAKCEEGGFVKETVCPDGNTETTTKCLGGWSCLKSTKKTTISKGEEATVDDPSKGPLVMKTGQVSMWTVDPSKGINLSPAPGNYKWKAEWGCYCCQTDWGLTNPFSMSMRRVAWDIRQDGNMECMLAWKMIGNGMADDPVDSSALGVLAMIPEFVITAADMLTLTLGRHIACASTCPFRNPQYEANQYSYTKVQTDLDKY